MPRAHDTFRSIQKHFKSFWNQKKDELFEYFLIDDINTFVFILTQCSKNVNVEYGKDITGRNENKAQKKLIILTGPGVGVPSYHAQSKGKTAVLGRRKEQGKSLG